MTARLREAAGGFFLALGFLTRLPAPGWAVPGGMASALRYLPAVGLLIGAAGAAVLLAASPLVPMSLAVLLSTAAVAALTGALHEDGLADTFDAVGAGSDRERSLEIMRDSRIGVYGALALGLVLALKVGALAAMPAGLAAAALVAGHGASRFSAVAVIATSRYARPSGSAAFTAAGMGRGGFAVAGAIGALALVGVVVAAGAGAALAAACGLAAGHLIARAVFERRLGGYTGDCLGATQQLSEVGLYLGIVAWL
jgi:adenosylcobinamide-GDP ribazoletransferase